MNDPLIYLTSLFALGMAAQWIAWRFQLPAILLLLGFGFLVGGVADSEAIIANDLLFPFVSLSVAIILFDGGLSLRFSELKETSSAVIRLVTVGCLVTWILGTLAAKLIFTDWGIAALAGAIFTVTGPTVIGPLLRQIRPVRSVGSIVKWEGIVIDPIGAVLAVLVYQVIIAGGTGNIASQIGITLSMTVLVSMLIGYATGQFLLLLFKKHWIPDYLQSPILLAAVLVSFTASNLIQTESGLATVTILGILLANQKRVSISHLVEFKENLGVLLISILFILLASRLHWDQVGELGWRAALFLLILIIFIRPIAIFVSTLGTKISTNEKLFLSWLAPRGIVAAAVASVFSLELLHHKELLDAAVLEEAELLVPLTFLTIIVTVTVYGLTASPLARKLDLADQSPQGILFAGADSLVRMIAKTLLDEGYHVHVVDTNHHNIRAARMMGISTTTASILSEFIHEEVDLGGIGRMIAMTPNDEVNSLAALEFSEVFGRSNVYQLTTQTAASKKRIQEASKHARFVFEDGTSQKLLTEKIENEFIVKTTRITDEFTFEHFQERYQSQANLLFVMDASRSLLIRTDSDEPTPKSGQTVIALVPNISAPETPS